MPAQEQQQRRQRPNILITGTPGTGKTTTAEQVAAQTGFQHVNVGQWVKDQGLHTGWDEAHQCYLLDEDKVPRVGRGCRRHACTAARQARGAEAAPPLLLHTRCVTRWRTTWQTAAWWWTITAATSSPSGERASSPPA